MGLKLESLSTRPFHTISYLRRIPSVLLPITAAGQLPGVTTISVSFSYHSSIKPNAGADTDGHHRPHVLPCREGEVSLSAHRNPVGRCRAPPGHSAHAGSSNSMPTTSGCILDFSTHNNSLWDQNRMTKRSVRCSFPNKFLVRICIAQIIAWSLGPHSDYGEWR